MKTAPGVVAELVIKNRMCQARAGLMGVACQIASSFIDYHGFPSIVADFVNRSIIFSVTSISIDFRYQPILIGGLN